MEAHNDHSRCCQPFDTYNVGYAKPCGDICEKESELGLANSEINIRSQCWIVCVSRRMPHSLFVFCLPKSSICYWKHLKELCWGKAIMAYTKPKIGRRGKA